MRLHAPVRRAAPVHCKVGHHAARDELLTHEVLRQAHRLRLAQLTRQRQLDLAGQLALPLRPAQPLARRHLIPQHLTV
jgi:hypothetical protein